MRRSPLRKKSKSKVSTVKDAIQAKIREKGIERDGGCIFRHYTHWLPFRYQECGYYRNDGELVLQFDHLVTRSHSASYTDLDSGVIVCYRHHFFFKKQHPAVYMDIVRRHIGEERWAKVMEYERQQRTHQTTHMVTADWEAALEKLQ